MWRSAGVQPEPPPEHPRSAGVQPERPPEPARSAGVQPEPAIETRSRSRARGEIPITPDGRYMVVRGRLWRRSNPELDPDLRALLVKALMEARRAVGRARRSGDAEALRAAGQQVDVAKRALGERGPVWWSDGAPDYNRRLAKNTPYADWYAALPSA